ncbi:MAG: acetyl-CoA C-acyltransferase, partial [Candidatus Microthrix parvicella]
MADVVIASAVRTPIGTSYKGTLAATTAQQLSEVAVGAALERSGVPAEAIED